MVSEEIIRKIWDSALDQFFKKETEQIGRDVSERSLCGRLSQYLQHEANEAGLERYFADPDNNRRHNGSIKTIINGQSKVIQITCDLTLHLRGKEVENDNLIAVEMKKSYRSEEEKADDRDRLLALTKATFDDIWSYDGMTHPKHVCGYRFGVYIELDRKKRHALIEFYRSGECVEKTARTF